MEIRKSRLGVFFLLPGILCLVIFFGTDQSQAPDVGFFLAGVLLLFLGFWLIRRDWKPAPTGERFRTVNKFKGRPKSKQKKA